MSDGTPSPIDQYDGIPNPNYDPNYGKRGKDNAFAPTLRMDVTDEKLRDYEAAGMTIEDVDKQLEQFFRDKFVSTRFRWFTADEITVIATGQVLEHFQSDIVASFEIEGVYHLKLATGDVVAVKTYRV